MDHRLIAAFAVMVSVISVIGILSVSDDSEVEGVTLDYTPDTVIDFSANSSVTLNLTVVQNGVTGVEIPVIYPDGFTDYNKCLSGGSSGIGAIDADFNLYLTEDSIRLVYFLGDESVSGTLNFRIGSLSLYFKIESVVDFSIEDHTDYPYGKCYDWYYSDGEPAVVGSPFEITLPEPGVSFFTFGQLNSVFCADFITLSEDGSKLVGTIPESYDSYNNATFPVFIQTSETDPYGYVCVVGAVPSHIEVVELVSDIDLVLGEPFEDCAVFEVDPSVEMDFEYSGLPEGVGFGTDSYGYRTYAFDIWGTPTVAGTYEVTITGVDDHSGLVSIDPVTVTINVLERFSVVFYDDGGAVISEQTVLDGRFLDTVPVYSPPEDRVFIGWSYYDGKSIITFDPASDPVTSDLVLYPQFYEPEPEPEPEPPVSDGVVTGGEPLLDYGMAFPAIFVLVLIVAFLAFAGVRRR